MNAKTIVMLAGVATGLCVLAFVVGTRGGTKPSQPTGSNTTSTNAIAGDPADEVGTLLFADAATRTNQVARVVVRQGDKILTFTRLETPAKISLKETSSWGINEKDNYPASDEKVRGLVRSVINVRSIEAKTSNAEWYPKLGVQDPLIQKPLVVDPTTQAPIDPAISAKADHAGHLVSLEDASGKPLARLIIGKKQDAANWDPAKAITYVRPADQAQSHAARATFQIPMEPTDWIKRQPLEVAPDRFHTVRIEHPTNPDGTAVAPIDIERPLAIVENYVLKQLPPGGERRIADALPTRSTLIALASLSADDVAKAATIDFARATISTYATFDGVIYTARIVTKDEKTWVNLRAVFDEAKFIPTTPPPILGGDDAATAKAKDDTADLDQQRRKQAAQAALDLDARLSPWAFQVSEALGKQLTPTLEDLLAPLERAPAMPAPGTPMPILPPQ